MFVNYLFFYLLFPKIINFFDICLVTGCRSIERRAKSRANIVDSGYRMQDTRCRMQDTGCRMQVVIL